MNLLRHNLKYMFRTSMMNCPKGVDLFRVQNEMVQLYTSLRSYAVIEIYNRNPYFLGSIAFDDQTKAKIAESEKQKYQINYKPTNKSENSQITPANDELKNQNLVEQQKLNNQLFTDFLKEAFTKPQKRHIFFFMVIFTTMTGFAKAYFEFNFPKTVPERARSFVPTQVPLFNMNQYSAHLSAMDTKINIYDQMFWKMIEQAKKEQEAL